MEKLYFLFYLNSPCTRFATYKENCNKLSKVKSVTTLFTMLHVCYIVVTVYNTPAAKLCHWLPVDTLLSLHGLHLGKLTVANC